MLTPSGRRLSEVLRTLFARYGLPEQVVSDNGLQFTSDEFAQFMKFNGVKPTIRHQTDKQNDLCRPSNGLEKGTSHHWVHVCRSLNRSTPHATTNSAPSELFLQRKVRTRFDLLKPDLQSKVDKEQARQKESHDKHSKTRQFSAGQPVMIRNFLSKLKWMPGTIKGQQGPVSYEIELDDGRVMRRHVEPNSHLPNQTRIPNPKTPVQKSFRNSSILNCPPHPKSIKGLVHLFVDTLFAIEGHQNA